MAAELPRPGIEVIQQFQSVSPTVITPTLVPCVVGVGKQVVDVQTTTAAGGTALNASAAVALQAQFIAIAAGGDPPVYGGLDGLNLDLSVNNAPPVSITFAGSSLSPLQVVAQVQKALSALGVTTATAETIGLASTATQWRFRTLGANDFQQIEILSTSNASVLSAFGLSAGRIYYGHSYYEQDVVGVNTASFPDPNKNLSQVVIDPETVRAFLYMGSGTTLTELLQTQSFLENGLALPAVTTGSVDLTTLTYGGSATVDGETIIITVNGASAPLTVTFAVPASIAALLGQINAVISSVAVATEDPITHHLVITTTPAIGPSASILIGAGTANTHLGLTPGTQVGVTAAASIADGSGTSLTSLIQLTDATLTTSATAAILTGTVSISSVTDGHTLVLDDGTGQQTLIFASASSSGAILSQINALFSPAHGGRLTASSSGGHLRLTNSFLGVESEITVVGGTALGELGLVVGTTRGTPFPAAVGDALYIGGIFYGTITQVAPGGVVDVVKIDSQVAVNNNLGLSWYIIAKNITASNMQSTKPTPDLQVDGVGNLNVKNDLIRQIDGTALSPSLGRATIYVAYQGVRQDLTALATNPALLQFSDTTTLTSQLSPVNASNPLALGLYFALLNSPGTQVTGLGVDAVTDDAPFGTVEAFTRAATFLEAFEVYGIAPLTNDSSVAQVFNTHVTVMSSPENKGERIVLVNPSQPTNAPDVLIASGLNGNSLPSGDLFDSGIANLGSLLLANNLTPGSFTVDQGLYLDIGDGNHYSIINTTGSQLTVQTSGFLPGQNDDGFYATTTLPGSLIASPLAIRVRGEALILTDGTPDKANIALAYQQLGQGYLNRRLWQVIAGGCAATLGGLNQSLPAFYLCAAIAGMIGQQPPQQSFTNFPMTGFTQVMGTNGYFSESQLNIIAAGGNYIIVQDAAGVPLISRMALTTDMTSIETRTDSITKVVDFSAKFLRTGLKNFIGRFNITQGFLDSLGHVIQGLLGFLAEAGVLIGSQLNNIIQDTDAPDTVLVDITLDVPFPCNYIRLTLVI